MGEHQDAQDMGAKNQKATKLSQGSCCALCMLSSLPTVSHLLFYCIEDAMSPVIFMSRLEAEKPSHPQLRSPGCVPGSETSEVKMRCLLGSVKCCNSSVTK